LKLPKEFAWGLRLDGFKGVIELLLPPTRGVDIIAWVIREEDYDQYVVDDTDGPPIRRLLASGQEHDAFVATELSTPSLNKTVVHADKPFDADRVALVHRRTEGSADIQAKAQADPSSNCHLL
jgi:hypothetical protein